MSPAPGGVRYVLDLAAQGEVFSYRGRLELESGACAVEVEVRRSKEAPDGFAATASAPEAPARHRAELERFAAALARGAVRGALKDGLSPPRRIHRWRELPGSVEEGGGEESR
jgi:hypothetical protein